MLHLRNQQTVLFKRETKMRCGIRSIAARSKHFHSFPPRCAHVGQKIVPIEVQEGAPSDKARISDIVAKVSRAYGLVSQQSGSNQGKHILVGVPGAFSPGCSVRHIPEYFRLADEFQEKGISSFNIVTVNDSFVTKTWKDVLTSKHGDNQLFRFFADPRGIFVGEMDIDFDASSIFGNRRSKRFAAVIEDGVISQLFVEPDNTGIDVSSAANVLKQL